jgi:D-3-phosphoglycerate dehydrogenase
MVDEPVTQIEVTLSGEASERNIRSISVESLVGLLSTKLSAPINRVNAISTALQHGTKLVESSRGAHPHYHATVSLTAQHGGNTTTVEGALFDRKHPRLVRVNDYAIEALLEGHLLLTRHKDQPGVVAAISSILAKQHINISSMQVGNVNGADAVAILGISTPVDGKTMQELAKVEPISKVMQVSL